jgi:hypothetical protein
MKKINLLLIILLTFSSCSDDDETVSSLEQNITEKWVLENRFMTDNDNYEVTDCIKQSSLEFFDDGTFERKEYGDDENGDCILTIELNGEWSTNGYNGLYLKVNGVVEQMAAGIGNRIDSLSLESDPNGDYLGISKFTETNQIIEIYKKNN